MKLNIEEQQELPTCCSSTNDCDGCKNDTTQNSSADTKWVRVEGSFLGISGANISCKCAISPSGIAPFSHLADGRIDLILIREVSRINHLRYLMTAATDSKRGVSRNICWHYKLQNLELSLHILY